MIGCGTLVLLFIGSRRYVVGFWACDRVAVVVWVDRDGSVDYKTKKVSLLPRVGLDGVIILHLKCVVRIMSLAFENLGFMHCLPFFVRRVVTIRGRCFHRMTNPEHLL